jgi:glucose/arabinose dehydrogenase
MAVVAMLGAGCNSSSAAHDTLDRIGAGLRGPRGTHARVYATGLRHVAAFAFDARGRLWVATAGYRDDGTDAVYMVTRAGATPVKVIAGLHTPLGLLWYRGALYVASKGRVVAYRALTGTRFATRRTVVAFGDHVGELNNLVESRGRMYVGISAPCDHCTPVSKWSGSIVSFLPEGRDVRVYARNIRAAVGLAFAPATRDLFVTMNQRDDLGARTPGDWLAVVREGDDWGFPSCWGQATAACSRVPAPIATLDPHAAVDGVAIVTGQLGPAVGTAAIVAEWSLGKVLRVELTRHGSTYRASVQPFLIAVKHPTAVVMTQQRRLLVGDWETGRVYEIASV